MEQTGSKVWWVVKVYEIRRMRGVTKLLKTLKDKLKQNNFKTSLNLIQTYKSLSIAEGVRLEPNNPVFVLKGKK